MGDRLERSRSERMLFGVAGGIARWIGVEPALVRIAFVALAFVNGLGVIVYLVLAVVLPVGEERSDAAHAGEQDPPTAQLAHPPYGPPVPPSGSVSAADRARARRATRVRQGLGGGIALVGLWLLARQLGLVPDLQWSIVAPLALIAVGLMLLTGRGGQPSGDAR